MQEEDQVPTEIVVVEDDLVTARLIEVILTQEGHLVRSYESGMDGMAHGLGSDTKLVILDGRLPDVDGVEVARFLRARSNVPILMLSGRDDVDSRVNGLDAGADDYLTKPFNPEELMARVRSLLRRREIHHAEASSAEVPVLQAGGWSLDPATHTLSGPGGGNAVLTGHESMILSILMRRAGSTISRDELMRQVAGRKWDFNDRSLDVHISHIRTKMKAMGSDTAPIQTVRGKGFSFRV